MSNIKKVILIITLILTTIVLSGCSYDFGTTNGTQNQEQKATESNQERLVEAVPIPKINTSEERKNLVRRLEVFNSEDKTSYIYLVNYGKVMAFYVIKGKVSSVNSLLTTPEQIVSSCSGAAGCSRHTVASPDIDGSYGENGAAIFFFTAEGVYVEWKGDYLLADAPLSLKTQPELVRNIK